MHIVQAFMHHAFLHKYGIDDLMSRDNFYDAAATTYVRYVLDELNLSPSALAKGAGLSSTTLTRALNDPEHKYTLSTSTLGKIMKFSGINFNPFFEAADFAEMSMAPFERDDITDDSWGKATPFSAEPTEGNVTIVIGHAASGVWKVPELLKIEKHTPLWITLPKVNATDAFAIMLDDDSSSPSVDKGEYALCLRMRAARSKPAHGDLLVVERWRDNGSLIEITLRRLICPEGGSPYLRFDNDQQFPEVIPFDLEAKETKVIGTVEWAIRNPTDFKLRAELLGRDRRTRQ